MATPTASPEYEEALTVFNHAAEEIRFFKGQQWLVTNYALLAYGAVAVTPELIDDNCLKAVASAVCAAVVFLPAGAAGWVLWGLDRAHRKELDRMDAAREKLPVVKKIHTDIGSRGTAASSWARGAGPGRTVWIMGVALIVGALLAIGINFSHAPSVAACLAARS